MRAGSQKGIQIFLWAKVYLYFEAKYRQMIGEYPTAKTKGNVAFPKDIPTPVVGAGVGAM
jgi:hypothetical protein